MSETFEDGIIDSYPDAKIFANFQKRVPLDGTRRFRRSNVYICTKIGIDTINLGHCVVISRAIACHNIQA